MIFIRIFVLTSIFFVVSASAESIAIVGSRAVKDEISLEDVKQVYLQNGFRARDGAVIIPVDYEEANLIRDEFYSRVLGKSRAQMKSYWARKIFTGKGTPPEIQKSAKEIRGYLNGSSEPVISYFRKSDLEKGDKVLLMLPE